MTLEKLARLTQQGFLSIDKRFNGVDKRLNGIDKRLDGIDKRLDGVEREIREMKENSGELFVKLDEFITLYKKQEEELLMFGAQLRRLEERIEKLEAR